MLGLQAYRIIEIPRRDTQRTADTPWDDGADPGRQQRAAALAAAYHAGIAAAPAAAYGALAFGWIRSAAGGPVRILTAGDGLVGSTMTNGDVLLSLPGGARGAPLRPEDMTGLLTEITCWREIAGVSDGLLAPAGGPRPAGTRAAAASPAMEDCLLGSWTGAFGWMVIAEPIPAADLLTLANDVARRLHLAEATADRFPGRAVEAHRLSARHAEFRRGSSSGFWRIRVMAGGRDEASAARVAGLFCASVALDGLPYALRPAVSPALSPSVSPAGAAPDDLSDGDAMPATLFCGSTELLAALARPPKRLRFRDRWNPRSSAQAC